MESGETSPVIPAKLGARRPQKLGLMPAASKGADRQDTAQQQWLHTHKHPGAERLARVTLQRGGVGGASWGGVEEGLVPTAVSHVPA